MKRMRLMIVSALITYFVYKPYMWNRAENASLTSDKEREREQKIK